MAIGTMPGFPTEASFLNQFKIAYGMTPGRFRGKKRV